MQAVNHEVQASLASIINRDMRIVVDQRIVLIRLQCAYRRIERPLGVISLETIIADQIVGDGTAIATEQAAARARRRNRFAAMAALGPRFG